MRQVIGFIALHLALIGVGLSALRAVGLIESPIGARQRWLWALGPALLTGLALVVPCLIVVLVLGIPLSLVTAAVVMVAWVLVSLLVGSVRGRSRTGQARGESDFEFGAGRCEAAGGGGELGAGGEPVFPARWLTGTVLVAAAYVVAGAVALARTATGGDDARIWSLRGLTLVYYGSLRAEIFLNPGQAGAHPVYPLFAPVTEALLSKAMGHPELRIYHSELWLIFCATLWTAAYLVGRRIGRGTAGSAIVSLAPIAALAVVPFAVINIVMGYVDTVASTLLAVGALAFGLWIDTGEGECLAMSALLLTAAASTKDEDLLGALCVIVVGALAVLIAPRVAGLSGRAAALRRLLPLVAAGAYFVVLVAPWRLWTAHHHLSDGVEPPLNHALNPAFLIQRGQELRTSARGMVTQVLANWNWVGAVFLVACGGCLVTRVARRVAAFYLASFVLIAVAILWLYTTTPASLPFLIPTSMNRTVGVFMTLALVATAHLLYELLAPRVRRPESTTPEVPPTVISRERAGASPT